jgi:MFS family permease
MRGRVMSLWFVAFQGSTPIGGPIVGWVIEWAGARAGLGLGAFTCLLAALLGLLVLRRRGWSPQRSRLRAAERADALA